MQQLTAAFLSTALLTIVLSGCIGGSNESSVDVGADASADASVDAENGTVEANVTVVTAVIVVSIDGNVTEAVNGTIEALQDQNVTFDGSQSEGDNLTFSWDFGDNATGSNMTEIHAFAGSGQFNVTLTVTAPDGTATTASVVLNVTSAGPAPGTVLRDEKKRFTGTVTQPVAEVYCGSSPAGMDKLTFTWEIAATEPDGTAVMVNRFQFKFMASATNIDTDYYFFGPDGKEIASAHGFEPTDGPEKPIDAQGEFAPGKYKVEVRSCASVNASITVDGTATIVAA